MITKKEAMEAMEEFQKECPTLKDILRVISGMGMMLQKQSSLINEVLDGENRSDEFRTKVIEAHRNGTLEENTELKELMRKDAEKMALCVTMARLILTAKPIEVIRKAKELAIEVENDHPDVFGTPKEKDNEEKWDDEVEAPSGGIRYHGEGGNA